MAPPRRRRALRRSSLELSFRLSYADAKPRLTLTRESGSRDPLHGITLEMILTSLVEQLGWEELGQRIDIRCFQNEPSLKSSLVFLRRTPWARKQVEELYLKLKGR